MPSRSTRQSSRYSLRFQEDGTLSLAKDGESWTRHFASLTAALQFVDSIGDKENAHFTFLDADGKEVTGPGFD